MASQRMNAILQLSADDDYLSTEDKNLIERFEVELDFIESFDRPDEAKVIVNESVTKAAGSVLATFVIQLLKKLRKAETPCLLLEGAVVKGEGAVERRAGVKLVELLFAEALIAGAESPFTALEWLFDAVTLDELAGYNDGKEGLVNKLVALKTRKAQNDFVNSYIDEGLRRLKL